MMHMKMSTCYKSAIRTTSIGTKPWTSLTQLFIFICEKVTTYYVVFTWGHAYFISMLEHKDFHSIKYYQGVICV